MADDPNFRWLGPHKGVVHLALASVTNACFDLWAKANDVPLWKLLIDFEAETIVNTLDMSSKLVVCDMQNSQEQLFAIKPQM
ncbi:MAG: hypothetical protein O2951_17015 [Bacteroidetes bacterium]|nr:hypothetical protein [Bacteroidota bacterium]